ncbi:hypothetical protein BDN70DRAFT_992568 [Pholiota conissans]|uniref:Uncharacterized protein n=1 Tax=Pholiota conissans TaxID=109636 RepID=A0A9P5Z4L4_9AGAR|nr:hypothetical protein BDN70DRAFT_992568 [Pholiota conissans]
MDPVSITLAVITLATALKDIIETANAIQDAFSKRPQNYKNAYKLAQSMLETLEELQEIYEENRAVMDGKKHLRRSIDNLLREIKSVYEQCIRLLPPMSERRRDKFRIAFYSFFRREKVERLLIDLNEHVDKCLLKFTALSTVRTETQVVEIHENMTVSNARTEARTEEILRTVSGSGHVNGNSTTGFRASHNDRLFAFAGSARMPMTSWLADTIPTHELSKAYLRRELARIDILSLSGNLRNRLQKQALRHPVGTDWLLNTPPQSDIQHHRNAVVLAFRAQTLLHEEFQIYAIEELFENLHLELMKLRMYEEALLIIDLLINLWKEVSKHHASRIASPWLAAALGRRVKYYLCIGDHQKAAVVTEEATRHLRSIAIEEEVDVDLKICCTELLIQNMLSQAILAARVSALQLIAEAGKHLWRTFGLGTISPADIPCALPSDWVNGDVKTLFHEGVCDDNRFTCAHSLFSMGRILLTNGKYAESTQSAKLALAILNDLYSRFPMASAAENAEYAEKRTTLIRELAHVSPQRYVIALAQALELQCEVLVDLGRTADAETVYQEMTSLGHLAATPAHLSINIPSEIEGDYYQQLARTHYNTGRFTDAVTAAQNAIAQYSALEFTEPQRSRLKHIQTVAVLCKYLAAAIRHGAAITEVFKAFDLFENPYIQSSAPNLAEVVQDLLEAILGAIKASSNLKIIPQIHNIGRVASKWHWTWFFVSYAELLQKRAMFEDAVAYFQNLLSLWRSTMVHLNDDKTALIIEYTSSLTRLCDTLEGGKIDRAVQHHREALQLARELSVDTRRHILVTPTMLILGCMTSRSVDFLCLAGLHDEAMELSTTFYRRASVTREQT